MCDARPFQEKAAQADHKEPNDKERITYFVGAAVIAPLQAVYALVVQLRRAEKPAPHHHGDQPREQGHAQCIQDQLVDIIEIAAIELPVGVDGANDIIV